mgnify:CR=1 FL=1|jgi:hypothetical protein
MHYPAANGIQLRHRSQGMPLILLIHVSGMQASRDDGIPAGFLSCHASPVIAVRKC